LRVLEAPLNYFKSLLKRLPALETRSAVEEEDFFEVFVFFAEVVFFADEVVFEEDAIFLEADVVFALEVEVPKSEPKTLETFTFFNIPVIDFVIEEVVSESAAAFVDFPKRLIKRGPNAERTEVTVFEETPASLAISFVSAELVPPIRCFIIFVPSERSIFLKKVLRFEVEVNACSARASVNDSAVDLSFDCLLALERSFGSAALITLFTSDLSSSVAFAILLMLEELINVVKIEETSIVLLLINFGYF
jgi:hypothetical protein